MSYPKLICKWCGKKFPSERLDTKYCSPHCREVANKIHKQEAEIKKDLFLDNEEDVKPKKSYEDYLWEARQRPPSPHLAPPGAKPPIRIPGHRNYY